LHIFQRRGRRKIKAENKKKKLKPEGVAYVVLALTRKKECRTPEMRSFDCEQAMGGGAPRVVDGTTRKAKVRMGTKADSLDRRSSVERLTAGAVLPVTVYDRTNSTEITRGRLESVDNQVDTTTGTVKLRAVFDNRDRKLFPQQFVNARLLVDTLQDAIIVPTAAIQLGAPGSYVYVVNSDSTVSIRVIKPGPIDGEQAVVLSGLELGETVVNDGVDRLYDGAKVQLPEKRPSNEAAERPHRFSGRPDGPPREHHHGGNGNEQRRHPPDAS
jgi:hypothetical protein